LCVFKVLIFSGGTHAISLCFWILQYYKLLSTVHSIYYVPDSSQNVQLLQHNNKQPMSNVHCLQTLSAVFHSLSKNGAGHM